MIKSTITRDRLQEIAEDGFLKHGESKALARMALAAMDSEPDRNPVLAYADSYRDMAKQGVESVPIWSVITDLERNIAPLYRHAQQPVVPEENHIGSKNALDAIVSFIKGKSNPTVKCYEEVSEQLFKDNCHGIHSHVIEYILKLGEELEDLRAEQAEMQPAPVVPDGLRLALSNAGIAAPESDEMLAATCEKHIQALVTWVRDRKPFQSAPVVMDDRKLRSLFDSWFASDCSFDLSPEASEEDNIAWRESYWYVWQRCRAAMLQAGNSPVIPDGYVMVPKEMTDEIGEAIAMQANCCGGIALDIYDAMLAAAPHDIPALNSLQSVDSVADRWIPVSERLPEDRTQVILWDAEIGEVTSGHYSHKTHTFYHCGDAIENEITHWMAPPAAQQELKK